jgi:hypothetical protein
MKRIHVRRRADLERALGKHKREMLVIIKDVCDRVAVSARGKRPAAEDPDDKQAAKRVWGCRDSAYAQGSADIGGIAKEWSVTEILQAVAGLLRMLLFISTSRELLEAIKGLGGIGSKRSGFRHVLERLLDFRGAAEEFTGFWGNLVLSIWRRSRRRRATTRRATTRRTMSTRSTRSTRRTRRTRTRKMSRRSKMPT